MSTPQTSAATATAKEPVALVIDTLAVAAPRVHGIGVAFDKAGHPVQIKNYSLSAEKATPMPLDHAMQFLKDSAFVVTDEKGNVMKPMENIAEKATHIALPEGCVIAKYEELTRDALVLRAKVLPNSGSIHPIKSKTSDVIAFLIAHDAAGKKPAKAQGMNEDELDRLFENE